MSKLSCKVNMSGLSMESRNRSKWKQEADFSSKRAVFSNNVHKISRLIVAPARNNRNQHCYYHTLFALVSKRESFHHVVQVWPYQLPTSRLILVEVVTLELSSQSAGVMLWFFHRLHDIQFCVRRRFDVGALVNDT